MAGTFMCVFILLWGFMFFTVNSVLMKCLLVSLRTLLVSLGRTTLELLYGDLMMDLNLICSSTNCAQLVCVCVVCVYA